MQEQQPILIQDDYAKRMEFYLPGSTRFAHALLLFLDHTNEYEVFRPWYDKFIDSVAWKHRYLDIGTGNGASLTNQTDRKFNFGIAIEKDEALLPAIKQHCPNIQIVPQMWQEVTEAYLREFVASHDSTFDPSDDGIFDLVQAVHLLYYIPESQHQTFFRQITKLVRPSGVILASLQDETSDYYALYHEFVPYEYNLRRLGEWFEAEFGQSGWHVTSEVLQGEVATDNLEVAQQIAEFMLCYVEFEPLPKKSEIEAWIKERLWQPEKGLYLAKNPQRVLICRRLF
jgi:hypothetical protein